MLLRHVSGLAMLFWMADGLTVNISVSLTTQNVTVKEKHIHSSDKGGSSGFAPQSFGQLDTLRAGVADDEVDEGNGTGDQDKENTISIDNEGLQLTPQAFRQLNGFRAGDAEDKADDKKKADKKKVNKSISKTDQQLLDGLKRLLEKKKKSGENLTKKEQDLVKSLQQLQRGKQMATGWKRDHFKNVPEIKTQEDLEKLIEELEKNGGLIPPYIPDDYITKSKESDESDQKLNCKEAKNSEERMTCLEKRYEDMLAMMIKFLDGKGKDKDSDEYDYSDYVGRNPNWWPPYRPTFPPPRPNPPPRPSCPGQTIINPEASLYQSPNCPCCNHGKCVRIPGSGWATCKCVGPFTGRFCQNGPSWSRKSGIRLSARRKNKPASDAKIEAQKPFKWSMDGPSEAEGPTTSTVKSSKKP